VDKTGAAEGHYVWFMLRKRIVLGQDRTEGGGCQFEKVGRK
jgi:hypothetical protein